MEKEKAKHAKQEMLKSFKYAGASAILLNSVT